MSTKTYIHKCVWPTPTPPPPRIITQACRRQLRLQGTGWGTNLSDYSGKRVSEETSGGGNKNNRFPKQRPSAVFISVRTVIWCRGFMWQKRSGWTHVSATRIELTFIQRWKLSLFFSFWLLAWLLPDYLLQEEQASSKLAYYSYLIVIYKFNYFCLGIPLEKVCGFITYSNVLSMIIR